MIRPVQYEDARDICEIYNHYILHSTVSFEEKAITPAEMGDRIKSYSSVLPWIVYAENSELLAFAYATKWRARSAYNRSVESSVYVRPGCSGRGIGKTIYKELIELLKQLKMHCVIGGIALPNDASIALHEKMGFEKVAHFRQVGRKMGRWVDVGYWELILADQAADAGDWQKECTEAV